MKRRMNRSPGNRTTLLLLSLACLAIAAGDMSLAAPDEPKLSDLIPRLGDESFPKREQASAAILELARKHTREVEKSLAVSYRKSSDPEIRFRCKGILMTHFIESVGYLGIYYQNREFINKDKEIQWAVGVGDIAPDSPAKAGGLQPGDVILAINGQAMDGLLPDKDFARRIQLLGGGTAVELTVVRGTEEMKLKVTLAPRPMTLPVVDAEALFQARLEQVEKQAGAD